MNQEDTQINRETRWKEWKGMYSMEWLKMISQKWQQSISQENISD